MVETDSLRRCSVLAPGGASLGGSLRRGLVRLPRLALLARGSATAARGRANRNLNAVLQFVESIDSNHFLRLQTLHGGHGSVRGAGRNGPQGSGLVTLNYVDISALGVALNRGSRNQDPIA